MPFSCFVLIILVGHAQLSNLPKRVPVYNEIETKLDYTYLLIKQRDTKFCKIKGHIKL